MSQTQTVERKPKYFLWDVITKTVEGFETNREAAEYKAKRLGGTIVYPVSKLAEKQAIEREVYGE